MERNRSAKVSALSGEGSFVTDQPSVFHSDYSQDVELRSHFLSLLFTFIIPLALISIFNAFISLSISPSAQSGGALPVSQIMGALYHAALSSVHQGLTFREREA